MSKTKYKLLVLKVAKNDYLQNEISARKM